MNDTGASFPFRISPEDFCRVFGAEWGEIPRIAQRILAERNFRYRRPSDAERDDILLSILRRIDSGGVWISGEDKREVWEQGWSENLREFEQTGELSRLWPKFLAGKKVLRLERDWIFPSDEAFEFNLIDIYRRWAFSKYFLGCSDIYEFGCGSCQHIPVLAEMYPNTIVHGLDWAESSVQIIERLASVRGWKLKGHVFDLFQPDEDFHLDPLAGVLTIGTLEQLGTKSEAFLQFLLKKRPRVVVHFESMRELYDPSNLPDYLAIRYSERRNYLSGYLPRIRELAEQGAVSILDVHRIQFGSMFHEPYSILVWRPAAD